MRRAVQGLRMPEMHPPTVAFAMLPEAGHYIGTFRLARALRERGARVVYIGLADFEPVAKKQGFEYARFAEDLLPPGYVERFVASQEKPVRGLRRRWRKRRADERLFEAYLRCIEEGELDSCLQACAPDVLLCDTFVWYVALRALRLGMPVVNLSIILSLYPNSLVPPLVFAMRPGQTPLEPLRIRAAWWWLRLKFFFTKRLASQLLGWYRFPTRTHHLVDVFRRVAMRSGYPCVEGCTYWFGEMGPRLILPEIVLAPRAFQFERCPEDDRRYMGDIVDLDRREDPLDEGAIDPSKPLVYCSIGTSPSFYPHAGRFYSAVVKASELRRDWQFVLHIGDFAAADRLGPAGPNLLMRRRVPQLALLRRAAVMVNHGGLNSILECVQFGTPMVIVPEMRDQPGNAARATHLGIGLTVKMSRITAERLVHLASRAMADPEIGEGLARLKQATAAESGLESALRFIQPFLSARRNGTLRQPPFKALKPPEPPAAPVKRLSS